MANFEYDSRNESTTENWNRWQARLKKFGDKLAWVIIALVVIIYLAQGIYVVQPSEVGLVKRFGKHVRTTKSGLNYHLPPPIESVQIENKLAVRKIEIGYETISPPPNPQYAIRKDEALMLTGDDNIVHLELAVQYTVKDAEKYGFNLINPKAIIKEAAEAIIRQEVVQRTVEEALTSERAEIAADAKRDLQALLDSYETGVLIEAIKVQDAKPPEPVIPAFDDVTSAKEDKNRKINEAEAYQNEVIPRAKGSAAEIINQAEAYSNEQINKAQGEVARFNKVLKQYNLGSQEVTRKRLYIETVEEILPGMKKIVLTESAGDGGSILKFLNLNNLEGEKK